MTIALATTFFVVAYNNVVNRWSAFHSWAYVPVNVASGWLVSSAAVSLAGLSWSEIAPLGELQPLAVVAVVVFGAVVFGIARSRHAHRIADQRVAQLRGISIPFHLLVRIPIGTAVFEELLFRGVLFALWLEAESSVVGASIASSVAFGLWHIAPSIIGLRMNDPDATRQIVRRAVVGAVLATFVAGLFLCWVRVKTAGLLSPIVLHGGINALGAGAAVAAARRTGSTLDP